MKDDTQRHKTTSERLYNLSDLSRATEAFNRVSAKAAFASFKSDRIFSAAAARHSVDTPDSFDVESATLADDSEFLKVVSAAQEQTALLREQTVAFSDFVRASERESRRQFVVNVVSLLVAALSLSVTFVSLLLQFGVIPA